MTTRFRFWLFAHDLAERLRAPYRIQHWLLLRLAGAARVAGMVDAIGEE